MKTREVILVGAGIAFGYLLVGYLKKAKNNSVTGTTTTSTDAVVSVIDQAKIDACNKEADEYMMTIRPMAGADLGAMRKQKFDACMEKSA
jgi:hypothetical protein